MSQDNYSRLARKLLTESLRVRKGENVTIETWNNGLPLASKVVLEAKRIGASPLVIFEDEDAFVEAATEVSKENLGKMGKHESSMLSQTDAYVFIPGPPLGGFSRQVPDEARSASTAYNSSWYDAAAKAKLRGVRLSHGYVGGDLAQAYGKSKDSIVRHLINAALCDYGEVKKDADRIVEKLVDGVDGRIVSGGQKLDFKFRGEVAVEDGVVDGKDITEENNVAYIPPGYVGKDVEPESVSGAIGFPVLITRYGKISGAEMRFKNGELVEWKARVGRETLNTIFNRAPQGKKTITYVTVGLNPVMKFGFTQDRFVKGAAGVTITSIASETGRRSTLIAGVIPKATASIAGKQI